MTFSNLFKEFAAWTSAHGIPLIGAARNWPIRIIWTIFFLGALAMFCYQTYGIIQSYLAFGVVVSTSVLYANTVWVIAA